MRMQAALLGASIEFRDGKFHLNGITNDLISPSFPGLANIDVIFMLSLDIEDFGLEADIEIVIVDPDGGTASGPIESVTFPNGEPGEATGWYRIFPFRDFQFAGPGTHEIILRVNAEEAGRMSLNVRNG